MERREVLKSMSLAMGYTLAPATLAGLVASCQQENTPVSGTPFFNASEALIIETLGETILPQTETPGSKAVNAHAFVAVFMAKVASEADQLKFRKGLAFWQEAFEQETGKPVASALEADFRASLEGYFGVDPQKQKALKELTGQATVPTPEEEKDYYLYHFLFTLKRLIMLGFFASEEIGENVLSYLPVPGRYEGCIPAEDIGNAWSL